MKNFSVLIDWKFVVALGAAAGITISVAKLDSSAAEQVLTHVVDACKDWLDACKRDR